MLFNIFYKLVLLWDNNAPKYGVIKYKRFVTNMGTFTGLLIWILTKCILMQM